MYHVRDIEICWDTSPKKKNLTLAPVIVWKNKEPSTFTGRLWNAVITSRHKMEMKYSDNGTISPLVHCSTDR